MTADEHQTTRSRGMRRGSRYLVIAAAGLLAAACGSVGAPGSAAHGTAGGHAAHSAPKVSLSVTVRDSPGSKPRHWTLQCDPAGGTHPDPAKACQVLLSSKKNPFAPLTGHRMCPMIMANSRSATVTGTWFGTKVHRMVADGGCDLPLWAKIGQVFG
ncbi:MAG TPA: SSI family serine proteinase inhibitor [Streptosporangiaceae bacterium]